MDDGRYDQCILAAPLTSMKVSFAWAWLFNAASDTMAASNNFFIGLMF